MDINSNNINSNTYNNFTNYCFHRLPCGYCRVMSSMCPLNYNITYQKYNFTCQSTNQELENLSTTTSTNNTE